MKNIEKYEHEISKLVNREYKLPCAIATVSGIKNSHTCDIKCIDCQKKCFEWLISEYNEPILTEEEKDIIRSMTDAIQKCGCKILYVCKSEEGEGIVCVWIKYKNELNKYNYLMDAPYVKDDMFKGMEINRNYSLEELGLENVNG